MMPAPERVERGHATISELVSGINYVGGDPKSIMAVDMNVWGAMVCDGDTITKFDVPGAVQDVVHAKTHNT